MDWDLENVLKVPIKIIIGSMVVMMAAMLFGQYVLGFSMFQGAMALNCPGYVDTINNVTSIENNSYNPNLPTIPYACALVKFAPAFIALIIILTMILYMAIPSNKNDQIQQQY